MKDGIPKDAQAKRLNPGRGEQELEVRFGNGRLALDMGSMGKGQIWISGQSIGRYWPAYKASGSCSSSCNYRGTYNDKKCRSNCMDASQRWSPASFGDLGSLSRDSNLSSSGLNNSGFGSSNCRRAGGMKAWCIVLLFLIRLGI